MKVKIDNNHIDTEDIEIISKIFEVKPKIKYDFDKHSYTDTTRYMFKIIMLTGDILKIYDTDYMTLNNIKQNLEKKLNNA